MIGLSTLEETWRYAHEDIFHKNDFLFFVIGQTVVTSITFMIVGGFFTYADWTGKPAWIQKYKVQQTKDIPVTRQLLLKAATVTGRNVLYVNAPLSVIVYAMERYMGCPFSTEELPTLGRFLRHLVGFILFEEIGFYYSHRLFHWGPLYKAIHKKHHEWTAPSAITAAYAHPLEHLVANAMPFILGPVLLSSHFATQLVWFMAALFGTLVHHSGYHLPFVLSPQFHDFHHLKFNNNFGLLGILDWFHGTDKLFRESVQYKRHRTLLGLRPIHLIYPDAKQTKEDQANSHVTQ